MDGLKGQAPGANPRLRPRRTDSRYYGLTRLREGLEGVIARHVVPLRDARPGLVAVDLGCGSKPYLALFSPHVSSYIGADLPANPLAEVAMDAATGRVDLAAGSADLVISTQVLEHHERPSAYLREAKRICRPDGLLILSTHGFWPYHPDPEDYWRWTASGLRRLLRESGWQVVAIDGILGFAAAAACLLQDALAPKVPRLVRGVFTTGVQQCAGLLDRLYTPGERRENAAVFLATARPLPEERECAS